MKTVLGAGKGDREKKKTLKNARPHPRHQTRDENDTVEIYCREAEKFNFAFFPYHQEQHPTTPGGRREYPARRENQLVCHDVSDLCIYACNFLRILPRYPRQPKGPTSLQLYNIYLGIIIAFKPLEVPGFR